MCYPWPPRQEISSWPQVGLAACADFPLCFLKLKNLFSSPVNAKCAAVNEEFCSHLARRSHLSSRFGLFFESISLSKRLTPSLWQWSFPNHVRIFKCWGEWETVSGFPSLVEMPDMTSIFPVNSRTFRQMHSKLLPDIVLEVSVRIKGRDSIKHLALCLARSRYSVMLVLTVATTVTPVVGPNLYKLDLPFPSGSWALP